MKLPGELAARFDPVRLLGEGAFGRVVLVRDRADDSPWALKLLTTDAGDARARFEREGRILLEVGSPRVAGAREQGAAGDAAYLLVRYVEGRDLRAELDAAGGRFPVPRALELFDGVLEGLAELHRRGVIHRDVKPENVLVGADGAPVLVDLGLGRAIAEETMTRTGTAMGTPAYMAPEQFAGRKATPATDVYAAALLACEMLTAEIPGDAGDLAETARRRAAGDLHGPRKYGVDLAAGTDEVLRRALDPDPAARPADAQALRDALARGTGPVPARANQATSVLGASLPAVTAASPVAAPAPPRPAPAAAAPPASRRWWALPAAGSLGLAAALAGLLAPGAPPPAPAPDAAPPGETPAPAARRDLRADLRAVLGTIEENEAVQAALRLSGKDSHQTAVGIFERGQEALRAEFAHHRLREILAPLDAETLPARAIPELTALQRLAALLDGHEPAKREAPLYPAGDDPGLWRVRQLVAAQSVVPAMDGEVPRAWDVRRERYRGALSRDGARWETVRSFEEDLGAGRKGDFNRYGVAWVFDPFGGRYSTMRETTLNDLVADRFMNSARLRMAEDLLRVRLAPVDGDLVLACSFYATERDDLIELEVRGEDGVLPLVVRVPYRDDRYTPEDVAKRSGVGLRIPRRFLPGRLRDMRVRWTGIQAIGTFSPTASLEEVLQLVEGEVPPGAFSRCPAP